MLGLAKSVLPYLATFRFARRKMIGIQKLVEALPLSQGLPHTSQQYPARNHSNGARESKFSKQEYDEDDKIIDGMSLPEKVFLLSGSSFTTTSGVPKHNLHRVTVSDGLSDVRGGHIYNGPAAAIFPNSTALAATFDTSLLRNIGQVLAHEMKLKSTQCLLAPNLNLHRDPRAGRNQETFGEDPFLAGAAGVAIVEGIHSQGLQTCSKHLVCNDSETSRKEYSVEVDERPLRELYLRPFEMMVARCKPAAIMSAYNKINGLHAASNPHILTDIVRKEWGYEGMIMSDWFGTYDGVSSLKAGMDIEMPFPAVRGPALLKAAAAGVVSQEDLKRSGKRVLGFLRRCQAPADRRAELPTDNAPARVALLRAAASEGILLLKNEQNKLPLSPSTTGALAVVGALATDRTLSHLVCPSYLTSPLQGIKSATGSSWTVKHAHGPQSYVLVPLLDSRYTDRIDFKLWNRGQKADTAAKPVLIETYKEAKVAFMMKHVEGLDAEFEIEMYAQVTVPETGEYRLGVVSCARAEVYINDIHVYTYQTGPVDPQTMLFTQHIMEQTFVHTFEAGKVYRLTCISQSQKQEGSEPAPSGLFFGMVKCRDNSEALRQAVELATQCDEVIICVGTTYEWEMEGIDRKTLSLPPGQPELLRAIIEARQGDVIVVNQSGAAVDLTCAMGAKAIVHAHYAGQEAGASIADVLFGYTNPSGRSPFTWPQRLEDCPSFGNFPHDENLLIRYTEGLHMGWRGFEKNATKPLFFDETAIQGTVGESSTVALSATIGNTGKVAGKQVLQVYVAGPSDSKVERCVKSLEGFAKTGLLEAGASERVTVELGKRAFSYWSPAEQAWKVEAGEYRVILSFSSDTVEKTLVYRITDAITWTGLA